MLETITYIYPKYLDRCVKQNCRHRSRNPLVLLSHLTVYFYAIYISNCTWGVCFKVKITYQIRLKWPWVDTNWAKTTQVRMTQGQNDTRLKTIIKTIIGASWLLSIFLQNKGEDHNKFCLPFFSSLWQKQYQPPKNWLCLTRTTYCNLKKKNIMPKPHIENYINCCLPCFFLVEKPLPNTPKILSFQIFNILFLSPKFLILQIFIILPLNTKYISFITSD